LPATFYFYKKAVRKDSFYNISTLNLKEKIEKLAENLGPAERAGLKLILANAVAESIDDFFLESNNPKAKAYKTCVASINRLQPHKDLIPENGVAYRGFPEFLSGRQLSILTEEADTFRQSAILFHEHFVYTDGPMAKEIAVSPELNKLLSKRIGDVRATGKANYIYYDRKGLGIEPHIDNEDFSLNVILMLKHEFEAVQSALVLYPIDKSPEKVYLEPGEMIAFFADSIIHARERMSENEKVTIAAFGFRPI
jgi:hypothetical protein